MSLIALSVAATLLAGSSTLGQLVLYVDADATAPVHDGSSWCAAYTAIQDALAHAGASGGRATEVRVAAGVYRPDQGASQTPGDREATFQLLSGVALRGGFAGCGAADPDERDIQLYETILSGDLNGDDTEYRNTIDNSRHVVTGSGTDETAVLDGLTITAGNAGDGVGAGMLNRGPSRPTLIDCKFSGNHAWDGAGGGVFNTDNGAPTFINCTFAQNTAQGGGAIYNLWASPRLVNCVFTANTAGGGGGGIFNVDSHPTLINCMFTGNQAWSNPGFGGAMYNVAGAPILINCTFRGNAAGNWGGGMYNEWSSPTMANCTFSGNSAIEGGGLFNAADSRPMLTNCTFVGNVAGDQGGGIHNYGASAPTLANCILWRNTDRSGMGESAQLHNEPNDSVPTPVINYTCLQGWTGLLGGRGNFGEDPWFVDADGADGMPGTEDDNLRLSPGSPCIDAGDNSAVPPEVETDLDGNPRFVNDPLTLDTGIGKPPIVDMGAYEHQVALLDIMPGRCPNRITSRGGGLLRAAIVGTEAFDVTRIDPGSLVLSRADGTGGRITPLRPGSAPAIIRKDVAAPFHGDLCDCHRSRRDGIEDLLLRFRLGHLLDTLELEAAARGTLVTLTLSGVLLDGSPFEASDCVLITGRR